MNIFNIQHFSTGDGKGIRTTVFFGSCPLRCPWCHNPECFNNDKTMTCDEVTGHILHDIDFYRRSGGGVTFSGGEPLCNMEDLLELVRFCHDNSINTAVDTSLALSADLSELAKLCDTFLVDIKTVDADKFRSVCRGELDTVFKNIDTLHSLGCDIIFRIPLIPGFNMDEVDDIIAFIKKYDYPVTLLPFHRLGEPKYKKLGMEWQYQDVKTSPKEEIEEIREKFNKANIKEARI